MKTFRKVIFWTHLICGLIAGISIFIMCLSGALLSFESNILGMAEKDMRYVRPAENAQTLSLNELINKVAAAKPDAKPSGVTLQNEKTAAVSIALGRDGQIFVDPYTGEITGEGAKGWRGFFRVVEDAHRWLALTGSGRNTGKTINDACNLIFLFLAISGVYIWFPRRLSWRHFKAAMTLRWKVKGRARDFNWHTVIGFWASLVLIILTLTAVIMSYQWAGNLLYTLTGNEPPAPQQQQQGPAPNQQPEQPALVVPANLNDLLTKAENHTTWKSISLRLPLVKDAAVFTIDEGKYWNLFGRSTLTLDAKTGEVAKWESYGEQNAGRQLRSWARFTHTGETGGIAGQIVGFLACIGGLFLVWTGVSLALRRFANWRLKGQVSAKS